MASVRVFISYDCNKDRTYRKMLETWSLSADVEFVFGFRQPGLRMKSVSAAPVMNVTTDQINSASFLLCVVGSASHKDEWINWEVKSAFEMGKKVIAVKPDISSATPDSLKRADVKWVKQFGSRFIEEAIKSAQRSG